VVNKVDLEPDGIELAAECLRPYAGERVPMHITSAETGTGIEGLREEMSRGISLLVGHSGVGKSSLLNAVSPGLRLGVGRVTDHHGRGRHTTTRVSLRALDAGGWVVDTPGIREFGMDDIPKAELARLYPGFGRLPEECRFSNCMHTLEPDCAVIAAVDEGSLDPERYEGYLRILEQLPAED
jgi:ribosome biogenesis GTPase